MFYKLKLTFHKFFYSPNFFSLFLTYNYLIMNKSILAILAIGLFFFGCSKSEKNDSTETEESTEQTKTTSETDTENQETEQKSIEDKIQGEWKVKEGMGYYKFEENNAATGMNDGGYTFTISEENGKTMINFTPKTDEGEAWSAEIFEITENTLGMENGGIKDTFFKQ